jgi:hypothetical protein
MRRVLALLTVAVASASGLIVPITTRAAFASLPYGSPCLFHGASPECVEALRVYTRLSEERCSPVCFAMFVDDGDAEARAAAGARRLPAMVVKGVGERCSCAERDLEIAVRGHAL